MRYYPEDDYDKKELKRLDAENWMVACLKMNPEYLGWGPYEDYMCDKKGGWASPQVRNGWDAFGPWKLDDLNEIVNFYFSIDREAEECTACDGTGYNPETKQISDDYYDFNETGRRWCKDLTEDEIQALMEYRKLSRGEAVARYKEDGLGCDALDRHMLIEVRGKRLGVYGLCGECNGHGHIFTEPKASLGLVVWIIHPRKGCSRGVHVKHIDKAELPEVVEYLRGAAKRNADRFSKLLAQTA